MLAHRGWEVYVLERAAGAESGWSETLERLVRAGRALGGPLIVLGADAGAAMALAACQSLPVLALALFAPVLPASLGKAYRRSLPWRSRIRRTRSGTVEPPRKLTRTAYQAADVAGEAAAFLDDLGRAADFELPSRHPPAIVFHAEGDPLVATTDSLPFLATPYAKASATKLQGRWWPSLGWEPVADEVHRFLILTLADRVVEFPEEVLET